MAEVLAVLGGLAAVIQLCTSARKFARVLLQFAADNGTATTEVKRFALQVQTFSDAIGITQITLCDFCRKNPNSPVVTFFASHRVLSKINLLAQHVQDHLQVIHDQVRGMNSRWMLWASILWTFHTKSSILALYPEMESVKTTLGLLTATAQLEAFLSSQAKGDAENKKQMYVSMGLLKTKSPAR